MRNARVWAGLLGIEHTCIEKIEYDEDEQLLVAHLRPSRTRRGRCGRCDRRCRGYDQGDGRRRWRALDLGFIQAVLEADAPRVTCPEHGVVVAAVPWARHATGHTRAFDDTVAWLAVQCSKTAVTELMRIAWRTVGAIITRVSADIDARVDRLAGLRRIGIDEISYKRGHRYLTVVVDHDARRLIWAAPGRDKATLGAFFDLLGEGRCAQITHVSADAADWIASVVAQRCPQAVRCADAFHVVAWATDALDQVRRQAWNDARKLARTEPKRPVGRPAADAPPRPGHERAKALKGARYALWKNPEDLTENQNEMLAWIATTDPRLHRAYLLKEGLRHVFAVKGQAGMDALDRWLSWARRCQIPSFIDLARKITKHRESINAALEHNMSNALVESTNTARTGTRSPGWRTPTSLQMCVGMSEVHRELVERRDCVTDGAACCLPLSDCPEAQMTSTSASAADRTGAGALTARTVRSPEPVPRAAARLRERRRVPRRWRVPDVRSRMPATVDIVILPSVSAQAARLLEVGVHELADVTAEPLRTLARDGDEGPGGVLLAVHPDVAPTSILTPLLRRGDLPGFVVVDMADVDRFTPLDEVTVPDAPLYFVDGLDRGDAMANWSPDEALPAITAQGRTPMLLSEGVHWLLQTPEVLERNRCFMTIGSRLRKPGGRLDARTPAIWISGGTGRDGRERRDAPKVGWCWAGNRHTWLGIASATGRRTSALPCRPATRPGA